MATTQATVITPSNLRSDHLEMQSGKLALVGALLNSFFKDVETGVMPDGTPAFVFTRFDGSTVTKPTELNDVHLDVSATGSSYNATTSILTLKLKNSTDTVTFDFSELSKTFTQDTATVQFLGSGQNTSKLQANVKLKANGSILAGPDGLYVDPALVAAAAGAMTVNVVDTEGNFLFAASPTQAV